MSKFRLHGAFLCVGCSKFDRSLRDPEWTELRICYSPSTYLFELRGLLQYINDVYICSCLLQQLLYGLEACPLKSADLKSVDYIVVGAFMKIFKTKSKEVATYCMEMFNCPMPSNDRKHKFLVKVSVSENMICRLCAECDK